MKMKLKIFLPEGWSWYPFPSIWNSGESSQDKFRKINFVFCFLLSIHVSSSLTPVHCSNERFRDYREINRISILVALLISKTQIIVCKEIPLHKINWMFCHIQTVLNDSFLPIIGYISKHFSLVLSMSSWPPLYSQSAVLSGLVSMLKSS